jgi:predicted nucleotidyltransferase
MSEIFAPTPYTDINTLLIEITDRIRAILGYQFTGLYLIGSLALGDFDPHTSDIDLIVVTNSEVTEEAFIALGEMHALLDRSGSPWAGKIETVYVPLDALNRSAPTSALYPQVEKGTTLFRAPLESGWAFQRFTLREHGIPIAGPTLSSVLKPVDPSDMHRAANTIVSLWLDQSRRDAEWISWARQRGGQAFVVLTLCRLLYSLETGSVASKPAAARWVQQALGPRWEALIQCSLANQQDELLTPESDLKDMLDLLVFTEKCIVRAAPID